MYNNSLAFIGLSIVAFIFYLIDSPAEDLPPITNIKAHVGGSEKGHKTENYILRALHSHGYGGFRLNTHPEWLVINDEVSGKEIQLELDLWDPENNVAIEYNGPQHYHFTEEHWTDFYDYAKYVKNSIAKEEICQRNGIELIVVPYCVPLEQLYDYIKSRFWDNRYIRDRYGINKPKPSRYIPEKIMKIDKLDVIMEAVVSRDLGEVITT